MGKIMLRETEPECGDSVWGWSSGRLCTSCVLLFVFVYELTKISISMLEAKALGVWWKAAWLSRFGIAAAFPAAILPAPW